MKNIILDTDIGVDCDDAVALALLLNAHKKNEITLKYVAASTARKGATGTVKAIATYYGVEVCTGILYRDYLECDYKNSYAEYVSREFSSPDSERDAIKDLRQIFSTVNQKFTYIAIGPLEGLARFLKSTGDEISDKTGLELFHERVDEVYMMGGAFSDSELYPEWNIFQSISGADCVTRMLKLPVYVVPAELGRMIMTGHTLTKEPDNPVFVSIEQFIKSELKIKNPTIYCRESWDPVTCYMALNPNTPLFRLSETGDVRVNKEGYTIFTPNKKGNYRIIKSVADSEMIADEINRCLPANKRGK